MIINGELIEKKVIVKKPKDVGRLYNKSHFGKTISGNKLELNLLESIFLLGENKIKIYQDKNEISFQKLIQKAAKTITNFEIKYLIFRDLRKRGHAVKLTKRDELFDFTIDNEKNEPSFFVCVFSERDNMDINETEKLIETALKNKRMLWFGIVDEEGDITYYDVSLPDLKGKIRKHKFPKSTGVLLDDRVIIYDEKLASALLSKEFFGKSFGIKSLQLSMVEALYLLEQKIIDIQDVDNVKFSPDNFRRYIEKSQPDINLRIVVFDDLKQRGFIVKTGFKFGAHFRAYMSLPDETHAEYLVHVLEKKYCGSWSEVSRAVRLAHSVNKEIIFAKISKNKVEYISFGRLRP